METGEKTIWVDCACPTFPWCAHHMEAEVQFALLAASRDVAATEMRRAWDTLDCYLNAEISGFPKVTKAMRVLAWGRVIAPVFDHDRHHIPDPVAEGLKRGLAIVGESDAEIADSAGSL